MRYKKYSHLESSKLFQKKISIRSELFPELKNRNFKTRYEMYMSGNLMGMYSDTRFVHLSIK